MITLPPFRLHRPRGISEALSLLHEHRVDARVIAGGTDLIVNLRQRLETPRHLVALEGLDELRAVDVSSTRGLRLGALVRIAEIAADRRIALLFPVLAEAARSVAAPAIRNAATLGGNLCLDTRCQWYNQSLFWRASCGFCLKKDGEVCHVAPGSSLCWAVYSADLAPALLTLDAEVRLASAQGERTVPLSRFFVEDGARKFDLAHDELVLEVMVPAARAGLRGAYRKLRPREALDFPLAGVAAAARVSADGRVSDARLAVTAAAPRPFLAEGVRELLEGRRVDDVEAVGRAAQLVHRVSNPMRTGGGYSPQHRKARIRLLAAEAIEALG